MAGRAQGGAGQRLAGSTRHYGYVSSRSVYAPPWMPGMTEQAPALAAQPDATDGEYGERKAGGELAAVSVFGERALIARTGLVLGPHEDVGRLPWWLRRIAEGGVVLAPGPKDLPLQYIDCRDLAAWLLDAAERGVTGTFNAVSRPGHTTMAELLGACRDATGSTAEFRWVAPEPILAAGVVPWAQLPIWIPPDHPFRPLHETNTDRAHAAGLRCRPITETVTDTWTWLRAANPAPGDVGVARDVEAAILASATE